MKPSDKQLTELTNRQLAERRRKLEKQWNAEPDEEKAHAIRLQIDEIMSVRNSRLSHLYGGQRVGAHEILDAYQQKILNEKLVIRKSY